MDNETRGIIAKILDDYVNSLNRKDSSDSITGWFAEDVLMEDIALDWITKDSKELSAELAVGYVIGYLVRIAHQIILDKKFKDKMSKVFNVQGQKTTQEDSESKKIKITKIYLGVNKAEINEVREMIKPKIPKIRTEVYKALSQ